jgi:hypothetical protein
MNDVITPKDRSLHSETMENHRATGSPVVIDLGKQPRKRIKELRKGKPGKLFHDVEEAIESLRAQNAIATDAQTVIVVVSEKQKKNRDMLRF